jgi:hypothetical protein
MTDPLQLTDAEVWQRIGNSADAIAHVALQAARIIGGRTSVTDPTRQAELIADQYRRWVGLKAEYDAYAIELERRHPKGGQGFGVEVL